MRWQAYHTPQSVDEALSLLNHYAGHAQIVAGGTDLNSSMPGDRYFMLGGPGSFPGFELGELRLTDYWTASGSYLWKLTDLMTIRGQALYAGVREMR